MKLKTLKHPKAFKPKKITRGGRPGFFHVEEEEPLRGEVNGIKAAQGEERFSRTLRKSKRVRKFMFRWSPGLAKGLPGWKELDYFVDATGFYLAISIKGMAFVHKNAGDVAQDRLNELIILGRLRGMGYNVPDIKSIPAEKLNNQKASDAVGRELGLL